MGVVNSSVLIGELLRDYDYSPQVRELKFSLFYDGEKGIGSVVPKYDINFQRLIEIYNCDFIKEQTSIIRSENCPLKKVKLKKQLPFITPQATFNGYRSGDKKAYFNENLLALDIDGLKPDDVHWVKNILTDYSGTILCAVSPRGGGIKALVLIADKIPLDNTYNVLKFNLNRIAEHLGLKDFIEKIDLSQFVPTQVMFINFDPNLYVNTNPEIKEMGLITIIENAYENIPSDINFLPQKSKQVSNGRINKYVLSATDTLVKFFALCADGDRHRNIIKVQSIASFLHYVPHLEDGVKQRLLNACKRMYNSEAEARQNNVYKSFERAWKGAIPKVNHTIEKIILEEGL